MKRVCIVLLFLGMITDQLFSQSFSDLDLSVPSTSIQNRIEIKIKASRYTQLQKKTGKKSELKKPKIMINGEEGISNSIRIRGQSSLDYRRKSLTVELEKKVKIFRQDSDYKLKKFYLISMSMDRYYYRSALSFSFLKELGLFKPFHAFTELIINGESQGIYLLMERPHDYAMKKEGSKCVIRRGYQGVINEVKYEEENALFPESDYIKTYQALYQQADELKGKDLFNAWNEHLDLDGYFRWLAFNFLVLNGDYTDEVYFYSVNDISNIRFKIIPWDYDDIFIGQIHLTGSPSLRRGWKNKLIFLGEEKLDRTIALDKYIYAKYQKVLQTVVSLLTEEKNHQVFRKMYEELYPYYQSEATIGMARYDEYGEVNLRDFQTDIQACYKYFQQRRKQVLELFIPEELPEVEEEY